VVNNEGVPIKSTLDNATTVQYSGLLNNLVDQVQYFYYFLSPLPVLKLG
jgi:dynein light chain roadblock-type